MSGKTSLYAIAMGLALVSAGIANAQQYGQNPAPSGRFVPLADGPVANGTTGDIGNDSSAGGQFGSSTEGGLNFGNGGITLTLTNNTSGNAGLYNFFASLGDFDLVFQSMTGAQVRVTSLLGDAGIVVRIDFGGSGGFDMDNDDDDTIDDSPGNPLAN